MFIKKYFSNPLNWVSGDIAIDPGNAGGYID